MKKQTAVEWLAQWLHDNPVVYQKDYFAAIEWAKAMEKGQSISDYCSGFQASGEAWKREYGLNDMLYMAEEIEAEKYYNETYGSGK